MIWSYFLATDSNANAKLGVSSYQGTPPPPKSRRRRWKWARWPDPVMCSFKDVTPHCNIQPHSPGCTWEEMTRGCGLDNVQRWKGGALPRQCFTPETVIKIGRDQLRSISPLPNMNLRLNEDKEDILEQADIRRGLFLKIWFCVFHLPCSQFHGGRLGDGVSLLWQTSWWLFQSL